MPKSLEKKDYVPEPTVESDKDLQEQAAETAAAVSALIDESTDPRDTAVPVAPEAPDVKVVLSDDFRKQVDATFDEEADKGQPVFISIAELPEGLGDDDRFEVPTTPTPVPAAVAAQLVESAAVEVAD